LNDEQILRFLDKLNEVSERLARVETMLRQRSVEMENVSNTLARHDERLTQLENNKAAFLGIKNLIAWGITVAIAVWGLMR
jgi:hypothetical protein